MGKASAFKLLRHSEGFCPTESSLLNNSKAGLLACIVGEGTSRTRQDALAVRFARNDSKTRALTNSVVAQPPRNDVMANEPLTLTLSRKGRGNSSPVTNLVHYYLNALVPSKKVAFTLAEVLITLGIIGVVAAMTLPSVINHIRNKGYVEGLKKAQSLLQNSTNQILVELGEPNNWIPWGLGIANSEGTAAAKAAQLKVVDMYASKLKVIQICENSGWTDTPCNFNNGKYKGLNGEAATSGAFPGVYRRSFALLLADGSTIAIRFGANESGNVFWGHPTLAFNVDVNGKNKPNTLGRDIFVLYLDNKGRVLPCGDGTCFYGQDDCTPDGIGTGCAYKVLTEGKMNY